MIEHEDKGTNGVITDAGTTVDLDALAAEEDRKAAAAEEANEDAAPPDEPNERKTRKDRRADRYKALETEAAEARRIADEARQETERVRRELQEMQRKSEAEKDPDAEINEKIQKAKQDMDAALDAASKGAGDMSRYFDAEVVLHELVSERAHNRRERNRPASNDGRATMLAILKTEFPDVLASEKATRYAEGEALRLFAKGAPDTIATHRAALSAAAAEFGLGGKSPAGNATRYAGIPSQGSATGTEAKTVSFSEGARKLAASYAQRRGISVEQAMRELAKDV